MPEARHLRAIEYTAAVRVGYEISNVRFYSVADTNLATWKAKRFHFLWSYEARADDRENAILALTHARF